MLAGPIERHRNVLSDRIVDWLIGGGGGGACGWGAGLRQRRRLSGRLGRLGLEAAGEQRGEAEDQAGRARRRAWVLSSRIGPFLE